MAIVCRDIILLVVNKNVFIEYMVFLKWLIYNILIYIIFTD
ncbi:hypothetical protein SSYIS1_00030 [Serratia symbiotica]|uniref:Uncharacterized protein n=1 Tax=Serratia symbiotica TaxID=138074 RepID=A0A455VCX8_9GAMM|nr:hypothetical protein SSYIS1_00030 [Serratia symbiotica]